MPEDEAGERRRAERLKGALRENLKRRKAQARGRDEAAPAAPPAERGAGEGGVAGSEAGLGPGNDRDPDTFEPSTG